MKRRRGFTLIELIIVLAIAGILIAIGVPNLAVFLKNSSRTTRLNDLVTALNYARSEAIKRNTAVLVCSSTDGAACANDPSFDSGWIVRQVDTGTVLRVFQQDMGGTTSFTGSDADGNDFHTFTYASNGFPDGDYGDITFTYCDDRGPTAARAVVVSNTGHPGISRDGDGNGTHNRADDPLVSGDLTC